ncbi:hypothetical protein BC936DRAFT_148742 [Jimgerdemannia flammicorona]|uniref:Uncharacterized protein n=1 Tax=Jimgerdemannia flammicorona TaxID=994334 RepID=A0A433DKJ4_9FUNG|nr:hypothetical protein BC936DRAFT_148742 [Jimgerdemannia flammicorona]
MEMLGNSRTQHSAPPRRTSPPRFQKRRNFRSTNPIDIGTKASTKSSATGHQQSQLITNANHVCSVGYMSKFALDNLINDSLGIQFEITASTFHQRGY